MRYLLLCSLLACSGLSHAQRFIQELRTSRNDLATGVLQDENGEYLMLIDARDTGQLNLTPMGRNGRLRVSRDIAFPFRVQMGDLVSWQDQDAYLLASNVTSATPAALAPLRDKLVARLSLDGTIVWASRFPGTAGPSPSTYSFQGTTKVLPAGSNTVVLASGLVFSDSLHKNDLFLANLDGEGNLNWAFQYAVTDSLLNAQTALSDFITTDDKGFLLGGTLTYPDGKQTAFLLKTNSAGQPQWFRTYDISEFPAPFNFVRLSSLVELKPGRYAWAGNAFGLLSNAPAARGLLVTVNDTGAVLTARRFSLPDTTVRIQTSEMLSLDSSSVVFGVKTLDIEADTLRTMNMLISVSANGQNLKWSKNYFSEKRKTASTPGRDALIKTIDGGFGYFVSIDTNFTAPKPSNNNPTLIKTNEDGETKCEQDLAFNWQNQNIQSVRRPIVPISQTAFTKVTADTVITFNDINPTFEGLELQGGGIECPPISVELDATVKEAETYKWSTGATTPKITATQPGLFTVEVESKKLCFYLPDTTVVQQAGPPTGTVAVNLDTFCEAKRALLVVAGQGIQQYNWSTGATTPFIDVNATGNYSVTITNICGSQTLTAEVPRLGCFCELMFPNAFSPNNDTYNDVFSAAMPCGRRISNYQIDIYNRWGQKIFTSNQEEKGWDGQVDGKPAPADVYVWYATYVLNGTETVEKTGSVTLLR